MLALCLRIGEDSRGIRLLVRRDHQWLAPECGLASMTMMKLLV